MAFKPTTRDDGAPLRVTTTEMHTEGEPLRIIESGCPPLKGDTLLDKREYAKTHLHRFRKFVTREPRGSNQTIAIVPVQPDVDSGAQVAAIFMDASVFYNMCGSGTLALARYAVDTGLVDTVTPLTTFKIQVPCGAVTAIVEVGPDGKTGASSFVSVPSFVYKADVEVVVPGYGTLNVDLCFGGAFYAILPASEVGLDVNTSPLDELGRASSTITSALRVQTRVEHPILNISLLAGTILTDGNDDDVDQPSVHFLTTSDHVLVSRSPCGSATTARAARLFFKNKLKLNQTRVFQSATTGSQFRATPRLQRPCGSYGAVEVELKGRAYYTGSSTLTLESGDRFGEGYIAGEARKYIV